MQMGGALPESFASKLRVKNATMSRYEKSLALAGVQGNLGFPGEAKQIRRLVGPRCGASRQDALVAADIDAFSEEKTDFEAWAAYRKIKKKSGRKRREHGDARKSVN